MLKRSVAFLAALFSLSGVASGQLFSPNVFVTDGTTGTTYATVKPASTAALATDTGLVVSINPLSFADVAPATQSVTAQDTVTVSLVGANGQTFYTGTPTAGSAAAFALASVKTVNVQASLLGGGGTMVVDVSYDGGTFWFRPDIYQHATQNYTNSFTAPFSITVNTAGATNIRVRAISSWTGTATIAIRESMNDRSVTVADALPPGGNVIGATKTTDGTNTAAVKAASTAPVATDPALVVALSPNGAQATSALQTTGNSSLASIDAGIPAALGQTTMSASMPVAIASDNGIATSANQSTEITSLQILDNVPASMNGAFVQGAPAMGQLDDTSTTVATEDNVAPIRITPQRAAHINLRNQAGTEIGTTANPVSVIVVDENVASYSTAFTGVASATTPTDLACILGSATKLVHVTRIEFSGTMTLSTAVSLQVIKRSAANTGGTSAALTLVPLDSGNAAATASAVSYTANPSALGAAVGTIRSSRYNVPTSGGVVSLPVVWDFGDRPAEAVILRGVAQELCINLSSTTLGGSALNGSFEFTEE